MAWTDAYATAAQYRTVTGKTDTGDDVQILLDLTAISRYIERKLSRVFNKDAAATTWDKYGNDQGYINIGDVVSITSVTEDTDDDNDFADETALATTEYELWPLNASQGEKMDGVFVGEPQPYTRLYIPSWSEQGTWVKSHKYRIVGVKGWPAVPTAITRACCDLTSLLRLETPRATDRIAEGVEGAMAISGQAQSIIWSLLKEYGHGSPSWGFV